MERLMIGLAHIGKYSGKWVDCYAGLKKPAEGYQHRRVGDAPVDIARNEIVRGFVEGDCTWLLQIDSDMGFHPLSLERLWSRTQEDPSIKMISALCFTRYKPPRPAIFGPITRIRKDGRQSVLIRVGETMEWLQRHPEALQECPTVLEPSPDDALVTCEATGAAFLLVHRDVFEAVGEPWFRRDTLKRGEDFWFFQRAREAGFQLWIDRGVICGHEWGDEYIGPSDFLAYHSTYPLGDRGVET